MDVFFKRRFNRLLGLVFVFYSVIAECGGRVGGGGGKGGCKNA